MDLVAIEKNGAPEKPLGDLPAFAQDIVRDTASLYRSAGYARPWVGYFALIDSDIVGFCAFKSAPKDGAVEIAYATMPEWEGRGVATQMAAALIDIARAAQNDIVILAQTLPEESASTSILRKLSFKKNRDVIHPEDGPVWEWRLGAE